MISISVDYGKSHSDRSQCNFYHWLGNPLIRIQLPNLCDIYQNFVYSIEMGMRCDNIDIMRHSSSNGFHSNDNSNNLNAKTIIKDIDCISDIYKLFWNSVTHIMFHE